LDPQRPHAPVFVQWGAVDGHAPPTPLPASAVQGAQAPTPRSHTGVAAMHALAFVAVQATQVLVAARHAGVAPWQSLSALHDRQRPALPPLVTQTPVRHCALDVHVPPPAGRPQTPSLAEHAPVAQRRTADVASQTPPGTGIPFAAPGVHPVPGTQ
jgi:hypothetical protein